MDGASENKSIAELSEKESTTIQTLAPDILAEIFMLCVPIDHYRLGNSMRVRTQAPLSLGRVCSRWRSVSISSPIIWSRLAIVGSGAREVGCEKDLEATNLWISRSGSCPLSILLHYPPQCSNLSILSPIIESLIAQSWRWKDIRISVPSELNSLILASFCTGQLPQLENFDFTVSDSGQPGKDSLSLKLSSAPRLQICRFSGKVGIHTNFDGQIHHVRNVNIMLDVGSAGMSLDDVLNLLTHCPLLEELTFFVKQCSTSHQQGRPSIIELSHLRHFSLALPPGIDPGYLVDTLRLPALTHLHLYMGINVVPDYSTDWPHLRTMLARSLPPLQFLTLSSVPIVEATLMECLSYTPLLISLSLSGCSDSILEFLTMDENNPSGDACPYLETLKFDRPSHFSSRAMIAMILSRRPSTNDIEGGNGKMLKYVDGVFSRMDNTIISHRDIAKCIQNGLKLDF
ncbi:hypothetical protein BD410DRAFT_901934 [Rickenella mellea]|uniref:F-box domain-containing protein n=1 Tax=Rickenella mellea TaxID=50990 RepID=A0A4Y7PNB0_9AGAM|nr:hypothetical protein BD410DRAFT_901934 [Rickenella mellea]